MRAYKAEATAVGPKVSGVHACIRACTNACMQAPASHLAGTTPLPADGGMNQPLTEPQSMPCSDAAAHTALFHANMLSCLHACLQAEV